MSRCDWECGQAGHMTSADLRCASRRRRYVGSIPLLATLALLTLAACGGDDDGAPSETRTATPTLTPLPTPDAQTPVITANWLAGPVALDTFESGLDGRDFLRGIYLQDAAGRFCTRNEQFAIRVDVDGNLERTLTVGAGRPSVWRVPIHSIPPAPAGTYDLVVECGAGFRIEEALRYAPDYVATATPTQPRSLAAVPTPPPAR